MKSKYLISSKASFFLTIDNIATDVVSFNVMSQCYYDVTVAQNISNVKFIC